ncbi:MAG: hypothetical protein AB7P40_31865 [Chloroflexota bacterium]
MELEEAMARIQELEGQVSALTGERDALGARLEEAASTRDAVVTDLATVQATSLTYLRRALLAEHAGTLVPELVTGDSEETLLASVETAKGAYARAVESARAAIVSQTVPAGAPSARSATATAGLSPLQLIESGLRR